MARTSLTPITLPTTYATTGAQLTWTAADPTNKNQFTFTGKEILLVKNDDSGPQTVSVKSALCSHQRSGDTSITLAAGAFGVFQPFFEAHGWLQSDGKIYVDAASADVKFAVLKVS